MVDINTYRSRIGRFSPKFSDKKYLLRRDFYKQASWNENNKFGEQTLVGDMAHNFPRLQFAI